MADPTRSERRRQGAESGAGAAFDLEQFCTLAKVAIEPDTDGADRILPRLREAYPPSLFAQLRDRNGEMVQCQFVRLAGPRINALAGRMNRTYVLGYFGGLETALADLAFGVMANPQTLSDIGEAGLELDSGVDRTVAIDGRARRTRGLGIAPRCPVRRAFAEVLVVAGLYYVMHHEFLHFYFGHVDYFVRNTTRPLILEATRPNRLGRKIDVYRHIAELEADGAAWRSLFTRQAIPAVSALCPGIRLTATDWARVFFDAMFLVTGLWTALDRGPVISIAGWKDWSEYPAGVIRARALYRSPFADTTFLGTLSSEADAALRAGFARSYGDMAEIGAIVPQLDFFARIAGHDWDDGGRAVLSERGRAAHSALPRAGRSIPAETGKTVTVR